MSGIMGVYHPDAKPLEPDILRAMLDVLAHRGKDGANLWCSNTVGLAHRMLWTTPESLLEKLPFCAQPRGLTITADARIDNREELISLLQLKDTPAEKITDSYLILEAYQKWGQDCPQKLLGDFAFAIWNEHQQELFCARDCFGIKPFYYYNSPQVFAFASEIKALFCVPQVPKQLNELRVAQYLVSNLDDKEITFYQGILRLPPAHSLTINPDSLTMQRYWSLDPSREVRLGSDAEYAAAYNQLFTQAVNCRLRSAFSVGSMLSGGLDSSSICCTARNLLKDTDKQLHTFSGVFPGLPEEDRKYVDERPYMDAVLNTGGFIAHQIQGDTLSPLYQQAQVFDHVDEPYMGPNYYLNWAIYEKAQQEGVRILLDGIDGDTTVSHGLECFADFARRGKWKSVIREARHYSRKMSLRKVSLSPLTIVWDFALSPLMPETLVKFWQRLRGQPDLPWYDASLINLDLVNSLNLKEQIEELDQSDLPLDTPAQQHCHAMNIGIHPYVLELADKGNSAFGIEPRYPFFDRRLVEFCVAIPVEQKFRNGWTRYMARIGMSGILPTEVQHRVCKADVGRNFKRKLFEQEQETLTSVIFSRSQEIAKYVDLSKLQAAYQRYKSKQASDDDIFCIYTTVNLSLWLRQLV